MYRRTIQEDDSTFSEIIMTLGIMGILALTFIILNAISAGPVKVANTKLEQTHFALQKWAQNITTTNETGFGEYNFFSSQEDLMKSLNTHLTTDSLREIAIKKLTPKTYSNPNEIITNNDVKITVKYIKNASEVPYCYDETPCAVITTSIDAKLEDNSIQTFTKEYALSANGLKNNEELYPAWEELKVYAVKFDTGYKYYYCMDTSCQEEGCTNKTFKKCNLAPIECQTGNCTNVYLSKTTYGKCLNENETGVIENRQIASMPGRVNPLIIDKCCAAPQVFKEFDILKNKICVCPTYGNIPINEGNIYSPEAENCEVPCPEGTFATYSRKNSSCKLCDAGKYCPEKATAKSTQKICPKGSYCPQKGTKDDSNYCDIKYRTDEDGNILAGGLINKIACPKGHYCPQEGLSEAKICPKGSYCPQEGMSAHIPCPKGTFSKELGATDASVCKPCPTNTFANAIGSIECTPCFLGTYTAKIEKDSKLGAERCIGCPPGSYYDNNIEGCKLCEAGTYQNKNSQLKCLPCPQGTYSNKISSTQCEPCPKGKCPETISNPKEKGATKCVPCE